MGETSLFNGDRVLKTSPTIRALAQIDLLNSQLGVIASHMDAHYYPVEDQERIILLQEDLMNISSVLATPPSASSTSKLNRVQLRSELVTGLERDIDEVDAKNPPLRDFILPGGGFLASQFHLARSFARLAEIETLNVREESSYPDEIFIYLNRMSDFLFACGRCYNVGGDVTLKSRHQKTD